MQGQQPRGGIPAGCTSERARPQSRHRSVLSNGVAVDGAGDLFIADRDKPPRREDNTQWRPDHGSRQRGTTTVTDPAVDAAGDVYFLDAGTELVLKVTAGGVQSTVPISIPGEGNGVAVDAAGDVFVSDQINNSGAGSFTRWRASRRCPPPV